MNLLIVNDEVLTADTMKEAIPWKSYGINEVLTAYNAKNARGLINAQNVDIMLCDIEMPGESGLSLLKWVRENNKAVECVFLTCHASFEYAREAIGLSCQDYILIPAKYEDIGEAVKKVVTRLENSRNESRFREYGEVVIKKIIEEVGQEKDPKMLVGEVKRYIMTHLDDKTLSVASVAEKFFFHPVYLNRFYKKLTGASVSQSILDARMKLAKILLEDGNISANVAAKRVGYYNYTSFFSAFKKYHGCSPSCIAKYSTIN